MLYLLVCVIAGPLLPPHLQVREEDYVAASFKLTWLALGVDHAEPSRGGEQATALGRL